jgi:sulfatase maturation enzyme AslB (radical SAM superfamily)
MARISPFCQKGCPKRAEISVKKKAKSRKEKREQAVYIIAVGKKALYGNRALWL